jgi:excinuclease UvrABC nuclease subunit
VTALYRIYDRAGRLLYVGISEDVEQRIVQHARTAGWVDEMASMTVESYPTRPAALAAELDAIHTEWPLWNYHGSPFASVSPRVAWERERFARITSGKILSRSEFAAWCARSNRIEDRARHIVRAALARGVVDPDDILEGGPDAA